MRLTRSPRRPRSDHRPTTLRPHRAPRTHPTGDQATTPPPISRGARDARRRVRGRLVVIGELVVLVLLLSAPAAHAHTTQVVALVGSVDQVLTNIRNWLMGILAALATVCLSIGGVRYVLGGGDPGEVEKAKTAIRAAGIGYALAALAPLVVTVLRGIVGA